MTVFEMIVAINIQKISKIHADRVVFYLMILLLLNCVLLYSIFVLIHLLKNSGVCFNGLLFCVLNSKAF